MIDTTNGQAFDRVRVHTSDEINQKLDEEMEERVRAFAEKSRDEQFEVRIKELDAEWDIERLLETNASVIALSGLVLGLTHSRKWLVVPAVVLPFLFQHAVQGWCPPLPVFRRLGVRTRNEIDRERYALKALRGDFVNNDAKRPAEAALRATA